MTFVYICSCKFFLFLYLLFFPFICCVYYSCSVILFFILFIYIFLFFVQYFHIFFYIIFPEQESWIKISILVSLCFNCFPSINQNNSNSKYTQNCLQPKSEKICFPTFVQTCKPQTRIIMKFFFQKSNINSNVYQWNVYTLRFEHYWVYKDINSVQLYTVGKSMHLPVQTIVLLSVHNV